MIRAIREIREALAEEKRQKEAQTFISDRSRVAASRIGCFLELQNQLQDPLPHLIGHVEAKDLPKGASKAELAHRIGQASMSKYSNIEYDPRVSTMPRDLIKNIDPKIDSDLIRNEIPEEDLIVVFRIAQPKPAIEDGMQNYQENA